MTNFVKFEQELVVIVQESLSENSERSVPFCSRIPYNISSHIGENRGAVEVYAMGKAEQFDSDNRTSFLLPD